MRNRVIEEDLGAITADGLPWDRFRGLAVLVTGANGFIPAYLVESLLHLNESRGLGLRVLAMVRDRGRAEARFAAYKGRPDLEVLVQDLGRPLEPIDGPVDVVIHAASQASPAYYDRDPVGTLGPNAIGTANLLELARARGSRGFLFLSGGEVYGRVDAAAGPVPEEAFGAVDSLAVRSCYAESKRMGETMCVAWHHQHGVPARIARLYHTYGPGMRLDDGRVYADFVADLLAGRDLVLKSDGSARRVFCYLSDAVRGLFTVLLQGDAGAAYNVANDEAEASIAELAERLVALFSEKGLKVVRAQRAQGDRYLPSPLQRTWPSTAKARALGWRPVVGIEEGFLRTLRSYA
jgi:nucleoside-diphosphate-sugar epimerase